MLGMITVVNSTSLFLYEYIILFLTIGVKLWVAFFISFTIPRLYSCYSIQMNQKGNPVHQYVLGFYVDCLYIHVTVMQVQIGCAAECMKWWVLEAWGACSHKKIVAASAVTAFWNLSSVKTRIFTGNNIAEYFDLWNNKRANCSQQFVG